MPNNPNTTASQANAGKSTGPGDTSLTRYNALKHGFTARHLTKLDNSAGYKDLFAQLHTELMPVGVLENFLVQRIALGMVRRCRGERLEAAFLNHDLLRKPATYIPIYGGETGPAVPLTSDTLADLCDLASRYETATARRLDADIKQLIALQKGRGKVSFVS